MSLENFEILSKLGDGAYSVVYKVRRKEDKQIYALKKVNMSNLSKKEKKNALNEVRILASISHQNVISYKEAFFDETGFLCLITEFADSGDLYQKIFKYQKRESFLSEHFIWNTFTQIVKGLKALHDLNILHRDMKSANVFLNMDGSVKLGDMNVSKVAKQGLLYTQTGTPYYASPEVWQDKPYNAKSDIWSLGCVLYEATTLSPPFQADDMQGLFNKVIKGEYHSIHSHFSKDLRHVIRALLQVDPNKRPSCDQILRMPAVQRHLVHFSESPEQLRLLSSIKMRDSMSISLPAPNYLTHGLKDTVNRSPSKSFKLEKFSQSSKEKDLSIERKRKRDLIRECYGPKLPKLRYAGKQSPQPIRKIRDIEEYFSLPKSLPAADRLKRLREAYLVRPTILGSGKY